MQESILADLPVNCQWQSDANGVWAAREIV
jgi:hypothetical protein